MTCRRFFRQYYSPNNASLAIVGDFDPAHAKALVEKYFGTLKRGPDVPANQGGDAQDHVRAPQGGERRASSFRASTWRG